MTASPSIWAVDATHANVGRLPATIPCVIGYASGTPDIKWTAGDWARFTGSKKVSNFQGYGAAPALGSMQELDVEARALTPAGAANIVAQRVLAGYQWTTIYGSDSAIKEVSTAVQALGSKIWVGHVMCRLADWDLNEEQAAAMLGKLVHGMTCAAVQWASPTSNPHTVVPGTSLTLADAQCDLSVALATWPDFVAQYHPPAPPPPAVQTGLLVLPTLGSKVVHSTNGGKSWS